MNVPFNDLKLHHESLQPELNEAIQRVIADCAFIRGQEVERFEEEFAAATNAKHCIATANGTDSLFIAMKALGIMQGDEVITTAHTWISTSETITQAGGQVVFCDTDKDTFTIDPARIEEKITSKTVGIIPVHLYGQPADMDPILEIAKKHNLWIIEDCAQAHLAEYKGRQVGTIGDVGTFSFYPGKNLGAMGDAGGIVTNDSKIADWMERYSRHGGKGEHTMEGINSRMDGIQGAVLRVKLPHLKNWTDKRQEAASLYNRELESTEQIEVPKIAPNRSHSFHLYVIKTDSRNELKEHLSKNGISTIINYPKALPYYPAYKYLKHTKHDFPTAHYQQGKILSLPIFPEITLDQSRQVINSIRSFYSAST